MKALGIAAAAILLTTASGGLAEEPAGEAAAKKEKKICKTEKMTGSLTRVRRICMTQSEWNRTAESMNRAVGRIATAANQAQAEATETPLPGSGGW
jgi:hypothetical protein